jgi:hypothetical protein
VPFFRITYTTPLKGHDIVDEIEWITESHWNAQQTLECFQSRFPSAAVIACAEIGDLPTTSVS